MHQTSFIKNCEDGIIEIHYDIDVGNAYHSLYFNLFGGHQALSTGTNTLVGLQGFIYI